MEDLDDLLEEPIARVFGLALLIARIVAVFSDNDHAINGQLTLPHVSASAMVGYIFNPGWREALSRLKSSRGV
jgi:hypothetical protein